MMELTNDDKLRILGFAIHLASETGDYKQIYKDIIKLLLDNA